MYKKIAAAPGHAQALRRQAGRAGRAAGRRPRRRWSRRSAPRWTPASSTLRPGADQLQEQVRGRLGAVPRHASGPTPPTPRCRWPSSSAWPSASPRVPANFKVHPLVEKVLADRAAMGRGEINVDWGMGEHLAFASLVASGYAGAPVGRGLRPRHLHATATRCCTTRTARSGTTAPTRRCRTSPTARRRSSSSTRCCPKRRCSASSTATRSAEPNTLVIWEAQFGDFVNGAQVVIDQFIASGEVEVGPRQRPDADAAARLRRPGPGALARRASSASCSSAADNNMQVVQPTSASQIFHLLRRQMVRMFRKPLIIMTPKSLLRAQGRDLAADRVHQGRVPDRDRRAERRDRRRARSSASSSARARSTTTWSRARDERKDATTSRSSASSSSIRSRTRRSRPS